MWFSEAFNDRYEKVNARNVSLIKYIEWYSHAYMLVFSHGKEIVVELLT